MGAPAVVVNFFDSLIRTSFVRSFRLLKSGSIFFALGANHVKMWKRLVAVIAVASIRKSKLQNLVDFLDDARKELILYILSIMYILTATGQ
jgi:hypothetical protein